jgi:hypothetical protein
MSADATRDVLTARAALSEAVTAIRETLACSPPQCAECTDLLRGVMRHGQLALDHDREETR